MKLSYLTQYLQQCKKNIEETSSIPQMLSELNEAETYEDDAWGKINQHIKEEREKKPPPPTGVEGVKEPLLAQTYPKQTVSLKPAQYADNKFIETEEQVEEYVNKLREKLLTAVNAGERIILK